LVAFGETSISACNDSIPRKQRLRWATPQTSTLGSYTKRKTLHRHGVMLEISLDTLTNFGHQGGKEFSEGIFKKNYVQ